MTVEDNAQCTMQETQLPKAFLHQSFIVHRQLCMKCRMLKTRNTIAEGFLMHDAQNTMHD
jgi:hypothetical protein